MVVRPDGLLIWRNRKHHMPYSNLRLLNYICFLLQIMKPLWRNFLYIVACVPGSYGSSDVGGVYSSSYGGEYTSRGSDVCF